MTYLGIDPGQDGAIGWISEDGPGAMVMPILAKRVDVKALRWELQALCPSFAAIEKAQVMPGQGAVSAHTIGLNYGLLLGVLHELKIPFTEVTPVSWKHAMGLPTLKGKFNTPKARKELSIAMAEKLFPSVDLRSSERAKNSHDGKAESLLLAEYARRVKA